MGQRREDVYKKGTEGKLSVGNKRGLRKVIQ